MVKMWRQLASHLVEQFCGHNGRPLCSLVSSDKLVSSHHKVISSILKFSAAFPSRPACCVTWKGDEDTGIILDLPCFGNNISSSAVTESCLFISYLIMPIIETCRISLSIKFCYYRSGKSHKQLGYHQIMSSMRIEYIRTAFNDWYTWIILFSYRLSWLK